MRRHVLLFPLILALLGLVVGCGGNADEAADDQAQVQSQAKEMVDQAQEAADAIGDRMAEAEDVAEAATFTGTIGCGHCTYHVTDECAPCMKTADGTVYVIDSPEQHDKLMGDRFSGKEITVVGTPEDDEGTMVLHASKVEIH